MREEPMNSSRARIKIRMRTWRQPSPQNVKRKEKIKKEKVHLVTLNHLLIASYFINLKIDLLIN